MFKVVEVRFGRKYDVVFKDDSLEACKIAADRQAATSIRKVVVINQQGCWVYVAN